jgi:endonuclease YncB( thermonuclease family)
MKHHFAAFLIAAMPLFALANTIDGRVVAIADGDTLTVLDSKNQQHKIRLAGIDAPEKSQPFGTRSKENLSSLAFGKPVTVEWSKTDKYGRTIGKVVVAGHDVNLLQVRSGLAWHYKAYEKEQSPADRTLYAQAETDAHNRGAGLWQDANPIPPWDYRHGTGAAASVNQAPSAEACPSGATICTGPKGGHYCLTAGGNKRYR